MVGKKVGQSRKKKIRSKGSNQGLEKVNESESGEPKDRLSSGKNRFASGSRGRSIKQGSSAEREGLHDTAYSFKSSTGGISGARAH